MLTKYTPKLGFIPLTVAEKEENRINFPKACNTSGTATNYIYNEIIKEYDRVLGSAIGELKFFSGALVSISAISLVLKLSSASQKENVNTSNWEADYSIVVIYLFLLMALIVRSYIIIRISRPNFDNYLKIYVMDNNGRKVTDLEVKEDYEWAEDLMPHLKYARKVEKRERFWRVIILGIFLVATMSMLWLLK